jgi:hypothetical protein
MKITKLSELSSGMPQMQTALQGWEVLILADYIKQEWVNGEPVEIKKTEKIIGTRQPLKFEEVALLPEGQRNWKHYWLHVDAKYKQLNIQQVVNIKDEDYRIMAVKDYSLNGFYEYHIVKDYQNNA